MKPFTPKMLAVARREFAQRVKSKWFLLTTLGAPLLIVALMGLSVFIALENATGAADSRAVIGVADRSGLIGDLVVEELLADSLQAARASELDDLSLSEAGERLSSVSYEMLLAIPSAAGRRAAEMEAREIALPTGEEAGDRTTLFSRDNVPTITEGTISSALRRASVRARLLSLGIQEIDTDALLLRTRFDVVNVTESGEARSQDLYRVVSFVVAFVFYMVLIIYGQMIVRAVLEEKQSDIVEVMVSSLRPWEMMLGKILGVGAVGLAQLAIWAVIVGGVAVFGVTAGSATLARANIDIASLGIPWGAVTLVPFFLMLGYLLYAGMFAGAGATISNEHDAQQALIPITMLIVIPFILIQGVIQNPNAGWAVIVSLVPFFSPLVMTSRLFIAAVPLWQWSLALALLAVSVLLSAWLAGRIYRVGVLMKGQRATLPQVVRWIRHG